MTPHIPLVFEHNSSYIWHLGFELYTQLDETCNYHCIVILLICCTACTVLFLRHPVQQVYSRSICNTESLTIISANWCNWKVYFQACVLKLNFIGYNLVTNFHEIQHNSLYVTMSLKTLVKATQAGQFEVAIIVSVFSFEMLFCLYPYNCKKLIYCSIELF